MIHHVVNMLVLSACVYEQNFENMQYLKIESLINYIHSASFWGLNFNHLSPGGGVGEKCIHIV